MIGIKSSMWKDCFCYQNVFEFVGKHFCFLGNKFMLPQQCFLVLPSQNATYLLQVVNFIGMLKVVNKLHQTCLFYQVATSLLKSGLLQLVICRLDINCQKQLDNQLAISLLTTCNRLVVNKLSQALRTHLDIGLL